MKKITVIGCGYVGLVTGACFAEMGHSVTCLDIDPLKVEKLEKGEIPFYEPGLQELVNRNVKGGRLHFSLEMSKIGEALFCFIAVGTPEGKDKKADLSQIEAAATSIASHLKRYTVVVNKSTAPVGTASYLKKMIALKLQRPIEFDVVSCPEFLKEGSAVDDFMKPDRIIIGSESEKATKLLTSLYAPFSLNHDRILLMDTPSAELTKYASNAMLATRISFMNELSWIAEKVGADLKAVRKGMSADHRIGYHFLYAGVGYGGSCFPKDIRALATLYSELESESPLLDAVELINQKQKLRLFMKLESFFAEHGGLEGKKIAIWGLSFKPNTDDLREAPSLFFIEALLSRGASLRLFDPVATQKAKERFKESSYLQFCQSEYEAAKGADAILLLTEWKQFRFVALDQVLSSMRGNAFFDGRNQYHYREMAELGFHYFGVGVPYLPPSQIEDYHLASLE